MLEKTKEENTPSRKTIHWIVLLGRVIPNTVVKTHNGDNTWRATSWEDSSLLASNLNKKEIGWIIGFFFLLVSWIICSSQPLHSVYVFLTKNSTSSDCSQRRVSLALTLAKIRKPPRLLGKRDI